MVFAIHRHKSHVSPHPEPPPTSLSTPFLWVVPEHQLWVPCFIHQTCTGHLFYICNIYVSVLFSPIVPLSPSPTYSKSLFFTSVSLLLSRIQGHRYHLSKFHIYALIGHQYFKKALQVVVMSLLGLAASANDSKKLLAELVKGPWIKYTFIHINIREQSEGMSIV